MTNLEERAKTMSVEEKIDEIYVAVKRMRRNMLIGLIFSVSLFILPLLAVAFSIPFLLDALSTYENIGNISSEGTLPTFPDLN